MITETKLQILGIIPFETKYSVFRKVEKRALYVIDDILYAAFKNKQEITDRYLRNKAWTYTINDEENKYGIKHILRDFSGYAWHIYRRVMKELEQKYKTDKETRQIALICYDIIDTHFNVLNENLKARRRRMELKYIDLDKIRQADMPVNISMFWQMCNMIDRAMESLLTEGNAIHRHDILGECILNKIKNMRYISYPDDRFIRFTYEEIEHLLDIQTYAISRGIDCPPIEKQYSYIMYYAEIILNYNQDYLFHCYKNAEDKK